MQACWFVFHHQARCLPQETGRGRRGAVRNDARAFYCFCGTDNVFRLLPGRRAESIDLCAKIDKYIAEAEARVTIAAGGGSGAAAALTKYASAEIHSYNQEALLQDSTEREKLWSRQSTMSICTA